MRINSRYYGDYAKPNGCFGNVAGLVRDRGGEAVMGWLVDASEEVHVHLHHAVWRNPLGELEEVTPQGIPGTPFATFPDDDFQPDPSATLVGGRARPTRFVPTAPKWERVAEYMNRSEEKVLAGDIGAANWWTQRADKERAKGHGGQYRATIYRIPHDYRIAPVPAEYLPYLPHQN